MCAADLPDLAQPDLPLFRLWLVPCVPYFCQFCIIVDLFGSFTFGNLLLKSLMVSVVFWDLVHVDTMNDLCWGVNCWPTIL